MIDAIWKVALDKYSRKEALLPDPAILHKVERDIMLQIVDAQWKDHLYSLDHLKEGIGLRGYGQRDPLVEYKKESFALFTAMKDRVEEEMVRYLWRLTPVDGDDATGTAAPVRRTPPRRPPSQIVLNSPQASAPSPFGAVGGGAAQRQEPRPARTGGDDVVRQVKRDEPKVGRNDPCPCGSGKKYKKCHGA
jgi:preprotein translocase subunit SecA